MSSVKKVVLAYSGGLDTSIIIPWLKEHYGDAEVIAFCGDVGQGDDYDAVKKKALDTGASKCIVKDLREEFVRDYCFKALAAGAIYEDRYLLGTALARPLLAYHQTQVALEEGADALSHGATGKGNDQVRFEVTYGAFAPHLTVIAPWREWDIRSREDALDYADKHAVPVESSKKDLYSRDGNLWHLSHEGDILENVWNAPKKEMFKLTVDPMDAPDEPETIVLAFEQGVPVALNGTRLGPVEMVETLNRVAGAHGVGRLDLVENRLVGIKSRGVYETPAGTVLHLAHRELERLVLDRDTLHFKQSISVRYAQLVYDGLWFSTLREALAAFVDETEKEVSGEVRIRLYKGVADANGRRSDSSLYREDLATFGEGMAYDHADAGGFIRLYGLPERVRALTRDKVTVDVKAVDITRPVGKPEGDEK
ncbi:MAG: argininosuccinate synthase [Acidobacteria bacterium]|jgi:argininosuccinate synthase|nr:argininosuccinate synthase [Acidobacteriota bacterium]